MRNEAQRGASQRDHVLLHQTGTDIWECQSPHRVMGMELGRRLTVVRLPSGRLWAHASLPPDAPLKAQLDGLGRLGAIVGPNCMHDDFLPEFAAAYPQAQFHAAPGLPQNNRALPPATLLTDDPPEEWEGVLEHHLVRGMPKLNEVVFFHRPSASLIIADLAFNLRPPKPWLTRVVMRMNGSYNRFAPSRFARSLISDRAAFSESIGRILRWDFRRIVVGHGENVEGEARRTFEGAFTSIR